MAEKGLKDTGVPAGSQKSGLIVTSNGIVFATVRNGEIYAYDMETGDILWRGKTGMGISSIPSMYEVNGKMYLVVSATRPKGRRPNSPRGPRNRQAIEDDHEGTSDNPSYMDEPAYQVFSLP